VVFKSLAESTTNPGELVMGGDFGATGFTMVDMTFSMVEKQIHVCMQGVYKFEANTGKMPGANSKADAVAVLALAKAFNAEHSIVEEVDPVVCNRIAINADVELQPMCAFFGGIVAQELVKISGKYTPIMQVTRAPPHAARLVFAIDLPDSRCSRHRVLRSGLRHSGSTFTPSRPCPRSARSRPTPSRSAAATTT
jgi:hypothetical protein